MKENANNMCRVPLTATYSYKSGEKVMIDAKWADIPADTILDFLLRKSGMIAHLTRCESPEGNAE